MAKKVKPETIEHYSILWNRFQVSNVSESEMESISYSEFSSRTNINSESQFRQVKALLRNSERQKEVNSYLDSKSIPETYTKRLPEKQLISKRDVKVSELKYKKSKYQVAGYDKHQASIRHTTHTKKGLKKHYNIVAQKVKSGNKELYNKASGFGIKTQIKLKIINPKDSSVSEATFYANGRLLTNVNDALNETKRFDDSFDKFTLRLSQSDLKYEIESIKTEVRVLV